MKSKANYQIFVADDDEDDQQIIKEVFNEYNSQIQVTAINSGIALLEVLTNRNGIGPGEMPHAIVLDINMPLMNGIETLEKIKKSDKLREIPVFILSTLRTVQRVDQSLELGALKYFIKPSRKKDYVTIVEQIVNECTYGSN